MGRARSGTAGRHIAVLRFECLNRGAGLISHLFDGGAARQVNKAFARGLLHVLLVGKVLQPRAALVGLWFEGGGSEGVRCENA